MYRATNTKLLSLLLKLTVVLVFAVPISSADVDTYTINYIIPYERPNITAWYNSVNGWNQTAVTENAGNTITFNVTVNQNVTNVSWKVAGGEEQNTSSLEFSRYFGTTGDFNVTALAFNENGSSNVVYTVVTITESGGPGTDYDYAYGTVRYDNGTAISGVTVTTSEGSDVTDAFGYYSFGYIFVHGSSYWFNATKSGLYPNNTLVAFSAGDYQVVNLTMSSVPPAQTLWNVSGYTFNDTGGILEGTLVSYSGGSNLSDTFGYWRIENVSNGTYDFTASKSGYVSNTTSITMDGGDLTNQNFTLAQITQVNVSGYIYNNLGVPLYQARVDAGNVYAITDSNGAYTLEGLDTYTEYSILARAIGYRNNTNTTEFTNTTEVNFTMYERRIGTTVSTPGFDGIALIFIVCLIIFIRRHRLC